MDKYELVIVGGGPAGLTAGIYAGRARLNAVLLESVSVPGLASLAGLVENYPGFPEGVNSFDLVDKLRKQAQVFGLEFLSGDVKNILPSKNKYLILETEQKQYNAEAIIIATGARYKQLGIPGEAEFRGKGVSYCATCDGPFFKNKDVLVVGGGDAAVEEALFLTRFVNKVTLVHRRKNLRAAGILQERAFNNKKIEFVLNSELVEISGRGRVEYGRVKSKETQAISELSCAAVFIFIGLVPNTDFLKDLLELDENGYIITDEQMKTSRPGIFACGDCRKKPFRQIITACGDGATAAFSAQKYLEEYL